MAETFARNRWAALGKGIKASGLDLRLWRNTARTLLRWGELKHFIKQLSWPILEGIGTAVLNSNEVVAQKVLMHQYRFLASNGSEQLPSLTDVGFRKYSEFEEDGILLYIFSLITPINRTCVEICAGNGRQCNTANLIINHGWWGHLFDGSEQNVREGRAFFLRNRDTFLYPPRFTRAWITAESVNDHIYNSGATGPVDLLKS